MKPGLAYMELVFHPNVSLISIVRRFVGDFYGSLFGDPETMSRLALASHELLENAAKYSSSGETKLRVQVAEAPPGEAARRRVSILTWNEAIPEEIDSLRRIFGALNAAPDPFAYYQQRMRETIKQSARSELGLARIRAEADMTLDCKVDGAMVCVIAEADTQPRCEP